MAELGRRLGAPPLNGAPVEAAAGQVDLAGQVWASPLTEQPLDVERCLLGRLFVPEEIGKAWDIGLRAEHFIEPLTQAVYHFTTAYWLENAKTAAPTALVLATEFSGLVLPTAVEESTTWLAGEIKRRFLRRQLQDVVMGSLTTLVEDPEGTLHTLTTAGFALKESTVARLSRVNMADTIAERRERYAKRRENPQGLGVTLGFDELDFHTGSLLPGELAVVGAMAKTGKTFMLLNAALNAVSKGHKPIVYSLEVSLSDMQDRADAILSGVSYDRLSKGRLFPDEEQTLYETQEILRDCGGLLIERPERGERTPAHLCARARQAGCDYMLIDQLSHMEAGHTTPNRKEQYASILKNLHDEISRPGMEIPCFLAVQARRGDTELTIESFADAAEVEREADILLGISRTDQEYDNEMMRMTILGARRCATAKWMLKWQLRGMTQMAIDGRIYPGDSR